jgi:hypothetical protein
MSEFINNEHQTGLVAGHPCRVYYEENELTRQLIENINNLNIKESTEAFKIFWEQLCKVELHWQRKENQLFPYLEKYGWTSPSQNMWAFHDQIRDEIKLANQSIRDKDIVAISQNIQAVFRSLDHIMQVEEHRLLPNAMNMLIGKRYLQVMMKLVGCLKKHLCHILNIFIQDKIKKDENYHSH